MTDKEGRSKSQARRRTATVKKRQPRSTEANPVLRSLAERFPLWRRPGYLIRRLHQVHYALFFEECDGFGITPVQYGLLTVLSTNPDSDQVALAHALGIDRTNVADVLRRLEQRGLVKRTPSLADRRMVLARLTRDGERVVESMHPAMARAQERLMRVLGDAEREAFLATLMRLLEANNKHGRAPLGSVRSGNI
jgi:DNA-binding MarR family transcriptional regulator